MKNLKQYIPHLIILIAVFLAGRLTSSDNSKEVDALREKERKLILKEIVEKQVEVTQLTIKNKAQDEKIAELETAVEKGDEKIKSLESRTRKKVEAVARYTPVQRDSFFYARYPGQDTIRNVDSRKVAIDLMRLEGVDSLNLALREQNDTLKAAVAEQKERIKTGEQKFQAQKEITSDFVRLSDSWRDQSGYYQKRSKKFHRQRDVLGVTALIVIVLSIVK